MYKNDIEMYKYLKKSQNNSGETRGNSGKLGETRGNSGNLGETRGTSGKLGELWELNFCKNLIK